MLTMIEQVLYPIHCKYYYTEVDMRQKIQSETKIADLYSCFRLNLLSRIKFSLWIYFCIVALAALKNLSYLFYCNQYHMVVNGSQKFSSEIKWSAVDFHLPLNYLSPTIFSIGLNFIFQCLQWTRKLLNQSGVSITIWSSIWDKKVNREQKHCD